MKRHALAAGLVLALAACQDGFDRSSKHLSPIPPATMSLMAAKGMKATDPIVIRSFKKEAEMEVWKRGSDGKYALLKTFPICRWSGQLGPKIKEGDRQAPEGFYTITPAQMNPNSSFYLSFDTGYPNAFDRAHGRTGSHLMVHGSCSSRGCFAMTDQAIAEVYAIGREAFVGGQRTFQFQSYPFRMTPQNLAQHRLDPHMAFWRNLKEGSDYFEATGQEPTVGVCNKRYVFGGPEVAQGSCDPETPDAVAEKAREDERAVAALVAKGVQPIKLVYDDGGQHQSFRQALAGSGEGVSLAVSSSASNRLGEVSRPEALAAGPQEILLDLNGKPKEAEPTVAFASAKPAPQAKPAPAASPVAAKPVQEAAADDKPFYKRMFSGIGDLLGQTKEPDPAPAPAPAAAKAPDRRAQAAPAGTPKTN
ncbi:MAG TPA: murein L,D-transpeptidase family protein [Microvirga sp.]|jgi:murein L,D-transpeptidase YafK|nr:murein L,D-transpeptidase family protein [Microvirga sp.]